MLPTRCQLLLSVQVSTEEVYVVASRPEAERLTALAALGLGPDAAAHDIVSAYRRLARASHPDTGDASPGSQDFARIHAAYRFLTRGDSLAGAPSRDTPPAAAAQERHPSSLADSAAWDVAELLSRRDQPFVAGPVIIRPLPPEST